MEYYIVSYVFRPNVQVVYILTSSRNDEQKKYPYLTHVKALSNTCKYSRHHYSVPITRGSHCTVFVQLTPN